MTTKTEKPMSFATRNRKTDLKNSQNHKTENPNAPLSNVGAPRKVFPYWSQKTRAHHSLSLFLHCFTVGELLHPFSTPNYSA